MKRLPAALTVLISCSPVLADHNRGFFLGGNASYISNEILVTDRVDEDEVKHPGIELVAGYKFNTWLGVDIRYGDASADRNFSTIQDTTTPNPGNIEYSLDAFQSFYYRPEFTNTEAKLYFLLGYTQIDARVEESALGNDTPVSVTDYSESGLSYGLGVGWFVDTHWNINIEYRMLLDEDENEFSIVTLGADYRF